KPLIISAQPSGVLFPLGEPPPPLKMEPIKYLVMSPGLMLFFSTCVICPIFSSSVMRASKSSTCASTDEWVEVATLEVGATADSVEETGDGVSAPHAESNSVIVPNKVKELVFIIGGWPLH